jgi:hypothetical protein
MEEERPAAQPPALQQALLQPYSLIEEVFSSAAAASGKSYEPLWVEAVPQRFLSLFSSDAALAAVPVLTAAALRSASVASGSLVRYVGMVQDTFDPEWFAAAATVEGSLRPCAFRDAVPGGGSDASAMSFDMLERR